MGYRRNGELTEECERNDRADEAAALLSQLVTQVGQLVARSQISYCGIWIVAETEVARFGYLQVALRLTVIALTFFRTWSSLRPPTGSAGVPPAMGA